MNGTPRGLWNTQNKNIAPRIGLAYALNPRTVLRAGYGIFFESLGADRNRRLSAGLQPENQPDAQSRPGLEFLRHNLQPIPGRAAGCARLEPGLEDFSRTFARLLRPRRCAPATCSAGASTCSMNFPHRVLLEAGYIGNRGTHQGLGEELNPTPAQYLSTSPVRDQATIDRLGAAVANPFYGLPEFAGSNLQGKTVGRNQLLRPYPHFAGVTTTSDGGFSWYHSHATARRQAFLARLHAASRLHMVEIHGSRREAESHGPRSAPRHLGAGSPAAHRAQRHL